MSTTDPATTMPPAPRLTLTLIVAATPTLGIGRAGTLPWPSLKKEMAYFARVTKRVPPHSSQHQQQGQGQQGQNVVIMGRKTWDSIPPKFRPLKDRLNVVVSRNPNAVQTQGQGGEQVLVADGLASALGMLEERGQRSQKEGSGPGPGLGLGRVFVIGGAALYRAALEDTPLLAKYVLLTKIWREYECDTFFPVDLEGDKAWVRRGHGELSEFVGEEVPEGRVKEGETEFEFCLYEKVDG